VGTGATGNMDIWAALPTTQKFVPQEGDRGFEAGRAGRAQCAESRRRPRSGSWPSGIVIDDARRRANPARKAPTNRTATIIPRT